jgi:hypothetical protein
MIAKSSVLEGVGAVWLVLGCGFDPEVLAGVLDMREERR